MENPELDRIANNLIARLWIDIPTDLAQEIVREALDQAVVTVQPTRPDESDMISPPGLEDRVAKLEKKVEGIYNRLHEAAVMLH